MPSVEAFNKILDLLRHESAETRNSYSNKTSNPVKVKVYSTVRYLAGGQGLDIHKNMGYSTESFRRIIIQRIDAVNNCKELYIELPYGNILKKVHEGFSDSI